MWTLSFAPNGGKETIGLLSAVYNAGQPDEFIFEDSVNIEDGGSVGDFVARAEKTRIVTEQDRLQSQAKVDELLSPIISLMEKMTTANLAAVGANTAVAPAQVK